MSVSTKKGGSIGCARQRRNGVLSGVAGLSKGHHFISSVLPASVALTLRHGTISSLYVDEMTNNLSSIISLKEWPFSETVD